MTHDRFAADDFPLTHEFLAHMLGLRREGVAEAAGALRRRELITCSRGNIRILDARGLKAWARMNCVATRAWNSASRGTSPSTMRFTAEPSLLLATAQTGRMHSHILQSSHRIVSSDGTAVGFKAVRWMRFSFRGNAGARPRLLPETPGTQPHDELRRYQSLQQRGILRRPQ
jgi:hypothetical protein